MPDLTAAERERLRNPMVKIDTETLEALQKEIASLRAALVEAKQTSHALAAQVEHFVSLIEGVELDYRLHGHLADLHVVASMLLPASPKESRRHE